MASKPSARKSVRGEYIETDNGNKISRKSKIEGTPHIVLGGRVVVMADACLRGDLVRLPKDASEEKENTRTSISVGKYTLIAPGVTLHPPHRVFRGGEISYYPMRIGENVFIGPDAFVSAASIANNVHIGRGAIVGNGCVIKDTVKILDGSILADGMVVPRGVVVGGRPARILTNLPDGWGAGGSAMATTVPGIGEWVEGGELRELIRSIK